MSVSSSSNNNNNDGDSSIGPQTSIATSVATDEEFVSNLIKSRNIEEKPSLILKKKLAEKWESLSGEQKEILRSQRARRGIKCHVCGTLGYYKETCINKCLSPPSTPDSDDTPPPTPNPNYFDMAVLWGDKFSNKEEEIGMNEKVDMKKLRPMMEEEKVRLKFEDKSVDDFHFFAHSSEGYSRNLPELTLHQVMRRLMRLLEKLLLKNAAKLEATFDTTLLVPPLKQEGDNFYPEELSKYREYDDYFNKHLLKQEWKKKHMYKGDIRPSEALDSVCRGGLANDDHLYKPNPAAGESVHAKVGWKSLLAKNDLLAASDPKMVKQMEEVKVMFHKKAAWIEMQKKNMSFQNDRWEHLVYIIRQEMGYEHERETRLLKAEKKQQVDEMLKIWQERFTSVDRLMDTLAKYNMYGGLDESDFLVYCLEQWKRKIQESQQALSGNETGVTKKQSSRVAKTIGNNINPYEFEITMFEKRHRKKTTKTGQSLQRPKPTANDLKELPSVAASDDDDDVDIDFDEFSKLRVSSVNASSVSSKSTYSITSRRKAMLESIDGSVKSVDAQIADAKMDTARYVKGEKERCLKLQEKGKKKGFVIKHVPHQREIDEANMALARETFSQANLERHIRRGNKNDVAYLAPTLIPVPGAFRGDGKDLSISHVAEQTFDRVQQNMIIGNIGYTPQQLLPLYVRNTLIEKNGTTPGGDQTQEIMALDRRYSHYMGRPLNRFEPSKSLQSTASVNSLGLPTIKSSKISNEMKAAKANEKRVQKMKYHPLTHSLVRLLFKKRLDDDNDIRFADS